MSSRHILLFFLLTILCFAHALNLSEGASCRWGKYNGTCISVYHCKTFILDQRDKKLPPVCGYRNEVPIICCTECPEEHVENITYGILNPRIGLLWKSGKKSSDACIDYVDKLPFNDILHNKADVRKVWLKKRKCHKVRQGLVGPSNGEDTKKAEHPFMALLGYGKRLQSAEWLCGGSIISDRFILTAAHCISTPRVGSVRYIALGVWKRSDPTEMWQIHTVKRIIPHPDYKSPFKYNDIALLKTSRPIEFTFGTLPACLHTGAPPRFEQFYGSEFALGWGSLGPGKHLADILQKVVLQNFTDAECAETYQPNRLLRHGYDRTTQMCYGDHSIARDTCQGDSGGPLVRNSEVIGYIRAIIGVTSYGLRCGENPGPGMYTRVAHYVPWIESIVWP